MLPTLTEIVRDLDPRLRAHLSSIRIESAKGGYRAQLKIHLMMPAAGRTANLGPEYEGTIDLDNLPEGVSCTGWTMYPDQWRMFTDEVDLAEQIRGLEDSDLVGLVDWARYEFDKDSVPAGYPQVSWMVKTHAGSDNERLNWALRNASEPHRWACLRCGHTWIPRIPGRPQTCAKCRSPYWDKPRRNERSRAKPNPLAVQRLRELAEEGGADVQR